jgi:hypothetical protein
VKPEQASKVTMRLIDESIIADRLFVTTHTLPLIFLIKVLREFVPEVRSKIFRQ